MASDVRSYKDLIIWQKSIKLVKDVYQLVHKFPKRETYALSDQLRRSVVSIPSNIAEGQARQYPAEFRQFLYIALGSAAEVDTQIIIALELGYITEQEANSIDLQLVEIRKMAYAIIQRLPKAQN
ncbi:MAG: four helix bundle protein [Chloroflexi bacterium]|nr:four helix bundle protein [Chloroflexota bacterium]